MHEMSKTMATNRCNNRIFSLFEQKKLNLTIFKSFSLDEM